MRAYLQLVRLPNVFTAMADILLGFLLTHSSLAPWPQLALLLATSSLLYMSGMVFNDYFDREQDARERPFRPIPSGRVTARTALALGVGMLAAGVALGWATSAAAGAWRPGLVATALATAVVLYDGVLKKTPVAPLVMGLCRTLNVLLGMSVSLGAWTAPYLVVAGGVGLYITGVTIFARTEARASARAQLALGVIVLLAGIALVASLPAWVTGGEWPPFRVPGGWYVFWALLALSLGYRFARAIVDPAPPLVQTAVRTGIFSLVVIDAAACVAVHDIAWAIVILLLLVPTLTLGRWIYST
jgi:4-hydroxybenzoate polyprenyltransferase